MTPLNFLLLLITELCAIGGQIMFKKAMSDEEARRSVFLRFMGLGILLKAIDFFLWQGLLGKYNLSYVYPFQDAVSRLLLLVAAWLFLKERATLHFWLGAGLITAGVALVSQS